MSTATMARNTENPRFSKKKEHSPADSMIFVDFRVSTNFGVSNGKLGFDFLLPNSAFENSGSQNSRRGLKSLWKSLFKELQLLIQLPSKIKVDT